MSECGHRGRLSEYLDGDMPGEAREAVRRHLEEEPACGCGRELRRLRELAGDLSALAPGEVPPGGWERIEAALEARAAAGRRRRGLAAAAGILLVLALGAWLLGRGGGPAGEAPAPVAELVPAGPEPARPAPDAPPFRRPEWMTVRSPVGEPPRLLARARSAELPGLELPGDLLQRYAVEIHAVDRLLEALEDLPEEERRRAEVREGRDRLRTLKSDLYTELVLQAQARRVAAW